VQARENGGRQGREGGGGSRPSVAVVVPVFNQARFLDDALRSLAAQTCPPARTIVVDDGSSDDPAAIVARFEGVELVGQDNAGLAAARNRGLAEAAGCEFVVFLDADDALLPRAIELGLACHREHPGCGFVYGGHRRTDTDLSPTGPPIYRPLDGSAYRALLEGNFIGSCGAVMFDRAKLVECGAFDPLLGKCEDYDAYFRLALRYPVAGHSATVADYRMHSANMSTDFVSMADWATRVQARYRPAAGEPAALAAYRRGRQRWWRIYAVALWRRPGDFAGRWAMVKRAPFASLLAAGAAGLRLVLPKRAYVAARQALVRRRNRLAPAAPGFPAQAEPISRGFGYDRGTPIDRWYIERFLAAHAGDIRGRVLEVGDDAYSRRFGKGVERQDVLHVTPGSPGATIVGDIAQAGTLPSEAFDCLVVTQTLHLIYDMPAAIEQLRRSLAPGGVLLLTVPGVSSVDPGEWGGTWHWSLTRASLERLLGEAFGSANVGVEAFGNVYAAASFLYGLAIEDVDSALLEPRDGAYPMVVCARARRAG